MTRYRSEVLLISGTPALIAVARRFDIATAPRPCEDHLRVADTVVIDLRTLRVTSDAEWFVQFSAYDRFTSVIAIDHESVDRSVLARVRVDVYWPELTAEVAFATWLHGRGRTLNAVDAIRGVRESPHASTSLGRAIIAALTAPGDVPSIDSLAVRCQVTAVTLRRQWSKSTARDDLRLQDLFRALRRIRRNEEDPCLADASLPESCFCARCCLAAMAITT